MAANFLVPAPMNLGAADGANRNGTIFESSQRTAAAYNSDEFHNPSALGVDIFVNVTAATGTVTVKLQKKDPVSGDWKDIAGATTAALSADAAFTVYPGIAETANVSISDHLGPVWRVVATVATDVVTFSVGASYLG